MKPAQSSWPSVEIQIRPFGVEGDVVGRGEPAGVAHRAAVACAVRRIGGIAAEKEEAPVATVAAWSGLPFTSGGTISMMWPNRLLARGLAGLSWSGLRCSL